MSKSPEEAALIAGVVAEPDDDAPRLIYADWLEEHGQAKRADLIRTQCALVAMKAHEEQLLQESGEQWTNEVFASFPKNAKISGVRFRRGFPEQIRMELQAFIEHHDAINAFTPLTHVSFSTLSYANIAENADAALAQFAALPVCQQIRSLEFGTPGADPDDNFFTGDYGLAGVRALAQSPFLANLRELRLHSHRVGIEGANVIATAPTFQNLTHLALTDPILNNENLDVRSFFRSPHLNQLQQAELGDQGGLIKICLGAEYLRTLRQDYQRSIATEGPTR